ncbi:MAG: 3-oxoacyl-ACP synthase [Leptolyngbya sp. SIO3F4]|nr:3-oxoacyl-ACP synthase [Leptolyngbya sp. SIO3F4]
MSTTKLSLDDLRGRKKEILRGIKPIKDKDIDYSDIPEINFNQIDWSQVQVYCPQGKEPITIRIDSDVLKWFRNNSERYQVHINQVLRVYYEAQTKK